tara:strand:+ start:292 stop:519 length:228 start_codon:yes stop_codon:yes gene_type:complete
MRTGIRRDAFNRALARTNLSQKDFADLAGLSPDYLSNLKNPNVKTNRHSCGPESRKKIIEAFEGQYCNEDLFYEF